MAALKAWAGSWDLPVKAVKGGAAAKPESVEIAVRAAKRELTSPEQLPAEARRKAQERLRFVDMVEAAKVSSRITEAAAVELVATNHALEFPILVSAGKKGASALTYANYRKWKQAMAENPKRELAALCDAYTRGSRDKYGDARFWEYFHAMYLNQNKLTAPVAYKRAAAKLRKEDPFAVIPKMHQAIYRLKELDLPTLILAREGEEAFKNRCMDFIRRDWAEVIPGDVIVCDSRIFDSRVKVWDEDKHAWKAVRPSIAGMMDAKSWYLPSYWITTDPVNHRTLINTLALYCVATGGVPPAVAYCDNGSDYLAKGFSTPLEVEGHEHSIFGELGITMVNSLAYNAKAKTIERMFRDMMQQFDKMFSDYLGSRPGQRTQAADWYDKHPEELPSAQEFCDLFHQWLHEYHHTPKRGDIHRGKTPAQVWGMRPRKAPLPVERLTMAFLKPEKILTVQRGPAITLDKTWYYSDLLFKHLGKKVLVKSDRLNDDHVFCFTADGQLICEAMTRPMIKALALDDDQAREAISESMARQRRQLKSTYTTLDDLTGGGHRVSPMELFLAQPGAELVRVGSKSSVKGAAHHYEHFRMSGKLPGASAAMEYRADGAGDGSDKSDGSDRELLAIEFREDAEFAALEEMQRSVMPPGADEDIDREDMELMHRLATSGKKDDFDIF